MGLKKDLKRMSAAIKAKFTSGYSGERNGEKKFNMFHYLLVIFAGFIIGYLIYFNILRKIPKNVYKDIK